MFEVQVAAEKFETPYETVAICGTRAEADAKRVELSNNGKIARVIVGAAAYAKMLARMGVKK